MNELVQHHPQMELIPIKEVEIDGIQMGVLNDGTAYLTARGLARMCGIDHTVILRLANRWDEEQYKPRGRRIRESLLSQGYPRNDLYIRTQARGSETLAFPDVVCMAVLEYYAFDAGLGNNSAALSNYRLLARSSFRAFIYNRCGYDPQQAIPDSWRTFHERILLNDQIPVGYFSVFREIADLVVHMIQAGCPLDSHTIPDLSVGKVWGTYWQNNSMDESYGLRVKHPHNFPDWFPQAVINPVEAWIYPVAALGDFRVWLYENYIPNSFPKYIDGKVKKGVFLPSSAQLMISAVSRPILTVDE